MRHRARVRALHYSPDGMKLVTLSDDRSVRLWDSTTGQPLSELARHPQSVEGAAFSPTGDRLVTASSSSTENSLWLWKTAARNALNRTFAVTSNKRSAHLIPQSGDLCIGSGHSLRIWPAGASQAEPAVLDLGVPVDFFNLSMDGTRSVIVSGNNVWVWDLPSRQSI